MKRLMTAVCCCMAACFAFERNPVLSGMVDTSFITIPRTDSIEGTRINQNVLDYSGMTYDHHRHKILIFGGGHATDFPTEVVEFDFSELKNRYVYSPFNCAVYDIISNALMNSNNEKLGGLRYNGNIYAGSRHTYDGLVMAADTCLMIAAQSMEHKGCGALTDENFRTYYQGGSGLFVLDPVAGVWTVSDSVNRSFMYSYSGVNPEAPDLFYGGEGSSSAFYSVNWKTMEKRRLADKPLKNVDMSMEYCPYRHSFFAFIGDTGNVCEYDIATDVWVNKRPAGDKPNLYSINVVYDTLNKVFACFSSSDNKLDHSWYFYYYSPAENRWYKVDRALTLNRLCHHHIYNPVDNVHLMIGTAWKTYAFKFSDTPGAFPGTGDAAAGTEHMPAAGSGLSLAVTPNPFRGQVRISLSARNGGNQPQPQQIAVFDSQGRRVKRFDPAPGSVVWQTGKTPAGIYLVKARCGVQQIFKKIVLM